jgi:hypothetical protein
MESSGSDLDSVTESCEIGHKVSGGTSMRMYFGSFVETTGRVAFSKKYKECSRS